MILGAVPAVEVCDMRTRTLVGATIAGSLIASLPSDAQERAPPDTAPLHGPIVNGRQLAPMRLPQTPPTTKARTSPEQRRELDDLYRDIMARSALPSKQAPATTSAGGDR